jgi:hypothetical protein
MAQPHGRVVGKVVAQVTTDLLWAPPPTKQLGDHAAQVIVGVDTASMVTCSSSGGSPMSIEGLIAATGWRVAPQLPRNRRRSSTESVRDRPQAQPGATQIGDLNTLVLRKVSCADLTDL